MKNSNKDINGTGTKANFFSNILVFLIISSAVVFSSCEQSDIEYIDGPRDEVKLAATEQERLAKSAGLNQVPFRFSLITTHCFSGGMGISVDIENPNEYAFNWEVNGRPGGHDISTPPCLCGEIATVNIMRLEDGVTYSKSITLPPCASEIK